MDLRPLPSPRLPLGARAPLDHQRPRPRALDGTAAAVGPVDKAWAAGPRSLVGDRNRRENLMGATRVADAATSTC